VEYLSWFYFWF